MLEARDIAYIIDAHTNKVKTTASEFRKWDLKTPYYIHPIWCASMILHETSLLEVIRTYGSQTLLYHDVVEDTTAELPPWLTPRVKAGVGGMTFESSEDEWKNLWGREKEVRLFKLYDKTSNLMDGAWMQPERRSKHVSHIRRIIEDVEKNYENLNILKLARAVL